MNKTVDKSSTTAAVSTTLGVIPADVDWAHQDVDIKREGRQIILPSDPGEMPIPVAIEALLRKQDEEEMLMDVHEDIEAYPLEGAAAFIKAMQILYGWASPVPRQGWFGPIPPDMLSVQVNVDEYIQVPWGNFKIPGVENPISLGVARKERLLILRVTGQVRKREKQVLLELARMTREILAKGSIYRGKALRIPHTSDGLDMENPPKFMDVRSVDPTELILNRSVENQVNVNVYAPILKTEAVRKAGIPLKRGVLLEGKYGVGKTMTTRITAKHCVDNGWTFIMVDRSENLREALEFAQRYQPAVVFCEDIDRATSERDEKANDLLNTIDGILGKNAEVMVVLTTNHVERIEKAMLRPGRLDAVITMAPPDAEAVQRLVQLYSRGLLRAGENLESVGQALAGNIPAVIREVVERSKLSMLAHGHTEMTAEDLLISADGMKSHLSLLADLPTPPTVEERVGKAIGDLVSVAVHGRDDEGNVIRPDDLKAVHGSLANGLRLLMRETSEVGGAVKGVAAEVANAKKRDAKLKETVDEVHAATV